MLSRMTTTVYPDHGSCTPLSISVWLTGCRQKNSTPVLFWDLKRVESYHCFVGALKQDMAVT